MVTRRTSFIEPALTSENKMRRVEHALSFIDDTTLYFEPMHNIVYVDEKRLYADRINRRSYLVFDGEGLPPRVWKSKRFVSKTTFLAALARPRYDPYRKQRWNGKVGVWSFTEKCEPSGEARTEPRALFVLVISKRSTTTCTRTIF
ncbi:hypothetical protein PC110_g17663 [Phytophthora cactorum]|uniref:Uncharacterized protein n=1 Tax=Phytophthora cactorum TaxID=29920 RepID=A0A329RRX5_9STRA|nr:hypothetical protein PC110_g17663 [Phytophthora cactorum]